MQPPLRTRVAPAAALAALTLLGACSSVTENRDPTGERFPSIAAETLAGDPLALPEDLADEPAVLLLGYVMKTQFDADRWLYGLLQAETPVRVLEVPTVAGLAASWFGDRIDEGMRSGIPSEDWGVVATVYGADAEALQTLTGTEVPRNVRVVLLDAGGIVRWFHDRGFSAGKLLELDAAARGLVDPGR